MGNFSRRDTFDALKHYVSVRLQQGVPLVDADWNEMDDIRRFELQSFIKHFIGDGVPVGEDGFHIKDIPNNQSNEGDFLISAGRILVNGWETKNESDQKDYVGIQYTKQLLYTNPEFAERWNVSPLHEIKGHPTDSDRQDYIYLDVWERLIDFIDFNENPELRDERLGVETCTRLKREWVVRLFAGDKEHNEFLQSPIPEGHAYYLLATIYYEAGTLPSRGIYDLRRTGIGSISQEITIKDGNVGIGIEEPRAMLDVKGDIALDNVDAIRLDWDAARLFPSGTGSQNQSNVVILGGDTGNNGQPVKTNLRVTGTLHVDSTLSSESMAVNGEVVLAIVGIKAGSVSKGNTTGSNLITLPTTPQITIYFA